VIYVLGWYFGHNTTFPPSPNDVREYTYSETLKKLKMAEQWKTSFRIFLRDAILLNDQSVMSLNIK